MLSTENDTVRAIRIFSFEQVENLLKTHSKHATEVQRCVNVLQTFRTRIRSEEKNRICMYVMVMC